MKKFILLFALLLSLTKILYAQTDTVKKLISVPLSFGFVSGNDYPNSLKNYLSDYKVSGYLGWLSLGLGIEANISKRFSFGPNVNVLYNTVTTSLNINGTQLPGSQSANIIILPGVSGKFYFYTHKRSSVYISAGAGTSIRESDFDDFIYKANGLEKELFIGYEFTSGFNERRNKVIRGGGYGIKLGYMSIPVTVTDNNTGSNDPKDFGGYALSIYGSF